MICVFVTHVARFYPECGSIEFTQNTGTIKLHSVTIQKTMRMILMFHGSGNLDNGLWVVTSFCG